MKVTYEFDYYEDRDELNKFRDIDKYTSALFELRDLARSIYKGWEEYDQEKIVDKLNDIVSISNIDDLP
ncbi:MAG: hypothetical protein KKH61_21640 [Gammaproteobacteria bacterium]|nr:hypothetical protein [Gammaproteobacteria bacterium]